MQKQEIVFTPYHKALKSLEDVLEQRNSDIDKTILRDSIVQRFEHSYEMMWKLFKRYLNLDHQISEANIRQLWKYAFKFNYIPDQDQWMMFHECRNLTSHTYSEYNAEKVEEIIDDFYTVAMDLLNKIESSYHATRG